MAKCFVTGIELAIREAFVLDTSAAHRALLNLRHRVCSLERLIAQFSHYDEVEVYDVRRHQMVKQKYRRVVSSQVSALLCAAYPETKLFISWPDWKERRREIMERYPGAALRHKKHDQQNPTTLSQSAEEVCHANNSE